MVMLMNMDPDIFIEKYQVWLRSPTHYVYSVDLSKYEKEKIPQKCKEILYRPNKFRRLKEKYWTIASELDKHEKETDKVEQRYRWSKRRMHKDEDEYQLMDRIVAVLDQMAEDFNANKQKVDFHVNNVISQYDDFDEDLAEELEDKIRNPEEMMTNSDEEDLSEEDSSSEEHSSTLTPQERYRRALSKRLEDDYSVYGDAFEMQANLIKKSIKTNGFCTKGQLRFLVEYEKFNEQRGAVLDKDRREDLKII